MSLPKARRCLLCTLEILHLSQYKLRFDFAQWAPEIHAEVWISPNSRMSKWWWPWWFVVLWFGIPGEFPLKAMQFFWASQRIPNHWDPKAPSPRSDAWSPCGSNISGMISATRPRKSIQRRTELCGWSLLVKIYRKDVKCRQHIPTIFNPDVGLFLQKRRSLTWDFKVLFVNQVIPRIQVF